MDPNENLKRQLELAQLVEDLSESGGVDDAGRVIEAAVELADLVRALDAWVRSGGFPPDAWTTGGAPRQGTVAFAHRTPPKLGGGRHAALNPRALWKAFDLTLDLDRLLDCASGGAPFMKGSGRPRERANKVRERRALALWQNHNAPEDAR
jgi:hypothetical protein